MYKFEARPCSTLALTILYFVTESDDVLNQENIICRVSRRLDEKSQLIVISLGSTRDNSMTTMCKAFSIYLTNKFQFQQIFWQTEFISFNRKPRCTALFPLLSGKCNSCSSNLTLLWLFQAFVIYFFFLLCIRYRQAES